MFLFIYSHFAFFTLVEAWMKFWKKDSQTEWSHSPKESSITNKKLCVEIIVFQYKKLLSIHCYLLNLKGNWKLFKNQLIIMWFRSNCRYYFFFFFQHHWFVMMFNTCLRKSTEIPFKLFDLKYIFFLI